MFPGLELEREKAGELLNLMLGKISGAAFYLKIHKRVAGYETGTSNKRIILAVNSFLRFEYKRMLQGLSRG